MTDHSIAKSISHALIIREYILDLIEQKALNNQNKLPAERLLCERFSITRITLRQALVQLETEGFVYRQHQRGWYLSPPRILYDPTKNLSFTALVLSQGRVPLNRILSSKRQIADKTMRKALQLQDHETDLYLIERLRSVDGRPVMVEHLYINAALCEGILDCAIEQSLTELLKQHFAVEIVRSSVNLHSTALTQTQAKELHGAAGTPSISVIRTNYDQQGRVIEIDQEFWRHDALEITASSSPNTSFEKNNGYDSTNTFDTAAKQQVGTDNFSTALNTLINEYSTGVQQSALQFQQLSKEFNDYRLRTDNELMQCRSRIATLEDDGDYRSDKFKLDP
ncbi:MAG: DNA-binding GntR family transcriptional regulator [Oceanospirillaceae bacterium]|jgi:DNA-binding GntR family transcriptional regulator